VGSLALGRIVVKEHSFLMNSLALATFLVKEILFRVNDSVANASYHTRTPVRQLLLQDLKSFGIESSSCIKTPKKPSVHSKSLRLKWFQQSVSYRNEQRSFRFRFKNLVRNTTSCFWGQIKDWNWIVLTEFSSLWDSTASYNFSSNRFQAFHVNVFWSQLKKYDLPESLFVITRTFLKTLTTTCECFLEENRRFRIQVLLSWGFLEVLFPIQHWNEFEQMSWGLSQLHETWWQFQ